MADSFVTNPWFIDGADDLSTSLPTYNGNTGEYSTYHIYKIIWFGATVAAGDSLIIKDADGKIKIQDETPTAKDRQLNFGQGLAMKGLNVHTMSHGELLVYHS